MITRRDVSRVAGVTGFRPEIVEKVLRLQFRVAFVCHMGASRLDARTIERSRPLVSRVALERDLQPLLRIEAEDIATRPRAEVGEWIEGIVPAAIDILLAWSDSERAFLDRLLDAGEINAAALHEDPRVQERILQQPMLAWKARHVRAHRRRT